MSDDRVIPSAVEMEESVIGAVIEYPEMLVNIIEILTSESFFDSKYRTIWKHIDKLYKAGKKVDMLMVTDSIKKAGDEEMAGGEWSVLEITGRVGSAGNAEEHAYILKEKHILRDFIKITGGALQDAYTRDIDAFEIIDRHLSLVSDLTALNGINKEKGSKQLWDEFIKRSQEARENLAKGITSGVGSGLVALDNITNGWQESNLIIIAGRPGMGKSALAKKCIIEATRQEESVLAFSLEMSANEWMARIASEETGLQAEKFIAGKHNITFDEKISDLAKTYVVNGVELLYIDDTPALSIPAMKSRAKRIFYSKKKKPKLIVVDYIQLMSAADKRRSNREQDVSEISRGLKEMAKELNVPVIALSQLSRAVETRGGDKKPQLSDLRESGAIEQDADLVLFIYRPDYYGIEQVEIDGKNGLELIDAKGLAEIIISKNRNGATGSVIVKYVDYLTKFMNMDDSGTLPF